MVAVKMIRRRGIVLTNTVRKEVLQIRSACNTIYPLPDRLLFILYSDWSCNRLLDHPNICKFIGATLRDPTKQAIVSEYCPKGSLHDVLTKRDISLNWGFRFSFVSDIAQGVSYLHQKRIYHTRLTSTNCLIDNRWTVKVTGI